jgi:CheY-like chemotaxis protein
VPAAVLLIEDDHAILESLSEVLAEEGYRVSTARNGAQALAQLGAVAPPDVILLDLMMPGMDGYEFRRHQLANPSLATIPTLVLTAGAVDARLRALNVQGWLKKPINLEALFAALARHCARSKPPVEPRPDHAVFFYREDAHLGAHVADYLADGLERGEVAVAVATAAHTAEIRRALTLRGVDVPALESAGLLELFDAEETLAGLLTNGSLSAARFRVLATKLITTAAARATSGRVRVFGEMVAILWQQGDVSAAVELEQLWNALTPELPFSILCSYPATASRGRRADDLCNVHTTVVWP